MKLDFDVDSIRKNTIDLLDCQIDLVLRSLEFYEHAYTFIYPRSKESKSLEENLRICLVRDTYTQILTEFSESKKQNPIIHIEEYKNDENYFEKFAKIY